MRMIGVTVVDQLLRQLHHCVVDGVVFRRVAPRASKTHNIAMKVQGKRGERQFLLE